MTYTSEDKDNFELATNCYLCGASFKDDVLKCRDHSHLNSKYLGAACVPCNLRRKRSATLKIFIHNGSRYDMHFIIKAMSAFKEKIRTTYVLPYNGENFRMLRFNSFEFLDTLSFLQASLSELSEGLKKSGHDYPILKQTYLVKKRGQFSKERFEMCLSKSFFPYEYCTSLDLMKKLWACQKENNFTVSYQRNK